MKTQTKRLLLAAVLIGMLLSVFTATTVMASTNGTACGDQQRDRIQNCDSCSQKNDSCSNAGDGAGTQQQHQYGTACATECTGDAPMSQARNRHQYRHCKNQGS